MFLQFFVPASKVLDVIMEKLEMCPFADSHIDSGNERWQIIDVVVVIPLLRVLFFASKLLSGELLHCW